MKIFQVHNRYRFYGGEDAVVDEEARLLKSYGHEVIQIIKDNNKEIILFKDKLTTLINISYSKKVFEVMEANIMKYGRPDVVHVHNIFPLWTYSIFDYFNIKNIPIIMSLHNYRLIWDQLGLFKKDRDKYGYFQDSFIKSFLISKLINKKKNLLNKISKFITLTEFTKKEFSLNGLPINKLIIKPNFLNSIDSKIIPIKKKNRAIYASRISKEKGILTLINAFRDINMELDVLGDGAMLNTIKKKNLNNRIKFYGSLERNETSKFINRSKFIVIPSECYEGFPMTILEAFREGTLVLASNIGSIKSIIKDKFNGILFEPGNTSDLIDKVKWILNNQKECDQIALNANNEFNKKYSSEVNYKQLIDVYQKVIKDNEN